MEKMINHTTEYRTRDLAETGALIVKKQKLIRIDRDGSTCYFVFENREECEELSNQFFFGDLLVNAREYHEATTRLKNRIFNSQ